MGELEWERQIRPIIIIPPSWLDKLTVSPVVARPLHPPPKRKKRQWEKIIIKILESRNTLWHTIISLFFIVP